MLANNMIQGKLITIFGILLLGTITLGFAQTDSEIFPEWLKTTMKFWADGLVTDAELKNVIEYLVEHQIIVIDKTTVEINMLVPTLSDKVISGVSFVGLDLTGVDFTGATITNVDFSGADLSGKDFSRIILRDINFTNTNLSDTNLSNQDFSNMELRGTILKNADLSNSVFTNANMRLASLFSANLTGADM